MSTEPTRARAITPKRAALGAGVLALAVPLVSLWEGLRTEPYLDAVGIPTVCYGETHAEMRRYTPAECRALLLQSLQAHAPPCLPEGLPDHVQAASLSFAYNVGTPAFCGSTMARKLQAGDVPGACAELSRWTYAGGRELAGLVKRRAAERAMCEGRAP